MARESDGLKTKKIAKDLYKINQIIFLRQKE